MGSLFPGLPQGRDSASSVSPPPGRRVLITVLAIALAWVVFAVVVALLPRPPRIPSIPENTTSLAGHALFHAVMALWIYLSARLWTPLTWKKAALLSVALASFVGLSIEVMQPVFSDTRAFQRRDLAADTAGAVLGAVVAAAWEMRGRPLRHLVVISGAVSAAVVTLTVAVLLVWPPGHPYRGDHWHTQYALIICGERQPAIPGFQGGIHSHGDSFIIHIHPGSTADSGRNATLGRFFEQAGWQLTDQSITVPGGGTYTDGDLCPEDGPGRLQVHRFDVATRSRAERIADPAGYVLQDVETLVIEFGSTPFDFSR